MSRIFINYRRQDSEGYVGRLYDHLLQHFEREDVFMDVDTISPGADFVQVLEEAVSSCDVFIAVIGPQWLVAKDETGTRRLDSWNDFVRIEITTALKQNKLVIPVLVGQARMPAPTDLPEDMVLLARRNAVELSHHRFSYDMQRLVKAIRENTSLTGGVKPKSDADVIARKETELKALREELVGATNAPFYQFRNENRHFPVLGEGNPDAKFLFIGQFPGKTEAETGVPFCGASGEIFNEMLRGIRLQREMVYVTNLVMDNPPLGYKLTQGDINFYIPFVDRVIDIVQPSVIVPLGAYAAIYLLNKLGVPSKTKAITVMHGKMVKAALPYGEVHALPMFHPAYIIREPEKKDDLRRDFEKLKLFI